MAGRKKTSATEPTASSEAEAAHILGLRDRSSIAGYIRQGCPGKTGAYPLVQMRNWIRDNIRQDGRSATGKADGEKNEIAVRMEMAELRRAEAEATLREVKLRIELGELVEREVVEAALRSLFNAIRHRLQAMPDEISFAMPPEFGPDVRAELITRLQIVLKELAECSDLPPAPLPAEQPPKPTATRGKRREKRAGSGGAAKPSSP